MKAFIKGLKKLRKVCLKFAAKVVAVVGLVVPSVVAVIDVILERCDTAEESAEPGLTGLPDPLEDTWNVAH